MLVNLVVGVASGCLAANVAIENALPFSSLAFNFALWMIFSLIYLFVDWSLGRFIPTLKRVGGLMLVILASLPWFTEAIVIVMLILRSGPPA